MRPKTIGGMASIKFRKKTLEEVVQSISGQLDCLYLYLNDYDEIPKFLLKYGNVKAILGSEARGDLNANGKLYLVDCETEGIAFTLDDDIVYPPDYVSRILVKLASYQNRACVAVHGSIIPDNASWYYERQRTYAMRQESTKSNIINIAGSGTAAFPLEMILRKGYQLNALVYVDLFISLSAHQAKFPMVTIERKADWLRPITYEGLWERFRSKITHHTHILQRENAWKSCNIRQIWQEVFAELVRRKIDAPGDHLNLSLSSIGFVYGEPLQSEFDDVVAIKKIIAFSEIWKN